MTRIVCVKLPDYDRLRLDFTQAGFDPINAECHVVAGFEAADLPDVLIFSGNELTEGNIRNLRRLDGGERVYVVCLSTSEVDYADATFSPKVDGKELVQSINRYLRMLETH